jgi:hypothetical protein
MFKNSGKKIKKFSEIVFYINIIGSIILSVYWIIDDIRSLFIVPFLFISSFIISLFLYAFGDLCDNVNLIRSNMYTLTTIMEKRFPDLAEDDIEEDDIKEDSNDN